MIHARPDPRVTNGARTRPYTYERPSGDAIRTRSNHVVDCTSTAKTAAGGVGVLAGSLHSDGRVDIPAPLHHLTRSRVPGGRRSLAAGQDLLAGWPKASTTVHLQYALSNQLTAFVKAKLVRMWTSTHKIGPACQPSIYRSPSNRLTEPHPYRRLRGAPVYRPKLCARNMSVHDGLLMTTNGAGPTSENRDQPDDCTHTTHAFSTPRQFRRRCRPVVPRAVLPRATERCETVHSPRQRTAQPLSS
jgi:hypothetical protein